ncbi:MAG: YbaK/EbsC family protein [Limnospira sp. PMC 1286.21]|uniref:prolyl-tRNA synthetase associated domain-containing protein n=1 Tax=Limnospira TaxID=2596745 RepID=UPI0014497808|nr:MULTISPECIES: YbaK/EbsC family protein [Limnospira]QJB29238.1 prolyl-tRNA synthetase associated domain-containing protein [Limnospira fusiformis SAG 85.79]MDT9209623.1 YbaK/EbsC family protein [Limnospira sp. PMC 1252.20]MDT9214809.1 YbaK/EbsC family protein [Limnospira sp. PMC 1256.20]MDT9219998.1 YbaK/EbsC family protein [Limnospira sp. PMC 1240.20]MDT9255700.1 YbaK/EbsC family protein [Limnospira sp. PMC 1254.20]
MIYEILDQVGIEYEKVLHPPVNNSEEGEKYYAQFNVGTSKNLFFRNRKGNKYYLVIIKPEKQVNLDLLAKNLGEKRLSLSSEERLLECLGQTPGSVSPFGLIHDLDNKVNVIIDIDVMKNEKLAFHVDENTSGIIINKSDFIKYLKWTKNNFDIIDFSKIIII